MMKETGDFSIDSTERILLWAMALKVYAIRYWEKRWGSDKENHIPIRSILHARPTYWSGDILTNHIYTTEIGSKEYEMWTHAALQLEGEGNPSSRLWLFSGGPVVARAREDGKEDGEKYLELGTFILPFHDPKRDIFYYVLLHLLESTDALVVDDHQRVLGIQGMQNPEDYTPKICYDTCRRGNPAGNYLWNYLKMHYFLEQEITGTRHVRLYGKRERIFCQNTGMDPNRIEPIKVVYLRKLRPDPSSPEGSHPVDWSHRWIVNEHWRDQWYPSKGTHIPKLIHAYEKGPKDKPLILKETITKVVR